MTSTYTTTINHIGNRSPKIRRRCQRRAVLAAPCYLVKCQYSGMKSPSASNATFASLLVTAWTARATCSG